MKISIANFAKSLVCFARSLFFNNGVRWFFAKYVKIPRSTQRENAQLMPLYGMQKKVVLFRELSVQNQSGIHARVSTMIALQCKNFVSDIRLRNEKGIADCRSVLDLLSLGAGYGTTVRLEVVGDDADEVVDVLTALFEARFNEDEESSRNHEKNHVIPVSPP